ncbi:MAG: hypothetical protein J6X55_17855 [Victivallales bacterium]|nr:hypothetical protein [Victivallales bacterium]
MKDDLFKKHPVKVAVVGRNLDDLMPILKDFPVQIVTQEPDLVISYGGDGSLLGSEQKYPSIPKFPLRDFRQNPKCPCHDERTVLQQLFNGQLKTSLLCKLHAELPDGMTLTGINDIVLSNLHVSSAIRYRLWLNGELFRGQIVADSLVVSTPFGSTGYFHSITRGTIQTGLGLAFSNSMDLNGFTIVPQDTVIDVELLRGPAHVAADNDPRVCQLKNGARIRIKISPTPTPAYGIDIFRCVDCYNLRRNGLN